MSYDTMTLNDKQFMTELLKHVKLKNRSPFGAMIVNSQTNEVLSIGINDSKSNPTLHAEMVAIQNLPRRMNQFEWQHCTLYTTAEPCPMCQGAIIWAGINRVVYGTSIETLTRLGWNQIPIHAEEINRRSPFYDGVLIPSVLSEETDRLFEG